MLTRRTPAAQSPLTRGGSCLLYTFKQVFRINGSLCSQRKFGISA